MVVPVLDEPSPAWGLRPQRWLAQAGHYAYWRRHLGIALLRDCHNRLRYGPSAPRHAERIWIDPVGCRLALRSIRRQESGKVVGGSWPPAGEVAVPIDSLPKFRFCVGRWVEGRSWEETGAYDFMLARIRKNRSPDGCRSLDDVVRRYRALDRLFEQIRRDQRLKTRQELSFVFFRESGGVYAHLGAGGEAFLGAGGLHRFAIAAILGLRCIPAQLGCIHLSALPRLPELRHTQA